MTAQFYEVLLHEGRPQVLYSTPLESYFETIKPRPEGLHRNTALERGYVGTWELDDGRLYLIGLYGYFGNRLNSLGQGEELTVEELFPGSGGRVFAEWFSGPLRLPRGKLLRRVMVGFHLYEEELLIHIEKGVAQGSSVIRNPPPPPIPEHVLKDVPAFLLRRDQDDD